ncbi:MAG: ABC transporter substrate-binding protein [bacterium]
MRSSLANSRVRFHVRCSRITALAVLAGVAPIACTKSTDTIWIGAVAMLDSTDSGEDSMRGIRLAVDAANRAGGIDGRHIQVRILRDSGRGELAVRVARDFVADDRILAVVGHEFSSAMIAAAPVYDGSLAAVATASSPQLSGISPWVFRVIPSDGKLGVEEARLFMAKGWRRVALLYVNDGYGRGLAGAFIPAFRSRGGTIVSRNPITDSTTDFNVYLREFAASRPDAVFVICGEKTAMPFLRAAAAHQLRAQIVGGDGWRSTLALDPRSNGIVWPSVFLPSDTQSIAVHFRRTFASRFGYEPEAPAALTYDGTLAILEAIRRGGATRRGVRAALADTSGVIVTGATGPISFRRGDRVGSVGGLMRVTNGVLTADVRWNDLPTP